MKIVYGILSAVAPPSTIADLTRILGSDAIRLIHHDWTQQPDMPVSGHNVEFVSEPARTGWANWGLSLAVFKLMETALARHRFDYFQLMTPACLPIKPQAALVAHLKRTVADFHVDHVPLDLAPNIRMSHAYRALAPAGSVRYRALWRARRWYFGENPATENLSNLSFPITNRIEAGGITGALAQLGQWATIRAAHSRRLGHPFDRDFRCHVGCSWFGASRSGCEALLEQSRDRRLMDWFTRVSMPGEIMMPSLIANSGLPIAASNYLLSVYEGARPRSFELDSLADLRKSPRFFARKFPEDVRAPIRIAVRERLLENRSEPMEMAL